MNKDLKQGLVLGVAFALLVSVMPSKAEDKIADDELCEKAVSYSAKYLPEENGGTLHQARWNIISGKRIDDVQKFVSLVIFEWGQRIGYTYDSDVHGEGTAWIEEQIATMVDACEKGIREARGNGYYDGLESANPDEAW